MAAMSHLIHSHIYVTSCDHSSVTGSKKTREKSSLIVYEAIVWPGMAGIRQTIAPFQLAQPSSLCAVYEIKIGIGKV